MKCHLRQFAGRRCQSVWAKMRKSESLTSEEISLSGWSPPPKSASPPEIVAVVEDQTNYTEPGMMNILQLEQEASVVDVDVMGPLRMTDPPWPHIKTPNSVQIDFQTEYDNELGIPFWGDVQRQQETKEENDIIILDHRWEPRPFFDDSIDYTVSYAFKDTYKMVGRETGEREFKGSGVFHETATRLVSIRTNKRIQSGDLAYFEITCQSSSLNFGIGIVEAPAFEPTKWLGYYDKSFGYFENGRIGSPDDHHYGRVIKVGDIIGCVLLCDPEKKSFQALFFKNGQPSGELIKIPKSEVGYYFGTTMASYHTGKSTCKINAEPDYLEESLEYFGRISDGSDVDFDAEIPSYEVKHIQPLCRNRKNPFHVCSNMCRELAPYYMTPQQDEFGKPSLITEPLSKSPSWTKQAGAGRGAGGDGVWKFVGRQDGKGRKFLNYKHIDIDAVPKGKPSMYKAARWNLKNMRYG